MPGPGLKLGWHVGNGNIRNLRKKIELGVCKLLEGV